MNEPYYKDDDVILFHNDLFLILPKMDAGSIDFIFADPPYFLSGGGITCVNGKMVSVNKGEWDKTKNPEEKLTFHRSWIKECRRVLNDNGSIMISATLHSVYSIGVALELEGFSIINNIVWQKTNPPPNLGCRSLTHSTETIIWARKQLGKTKKGKHTFNYNLMKEENNNKQLKDFWEFTEEGDVIYVSSTTPKSEKSEGKHPTQKPLKLLERIIKLATNEGDIILDPFNGSGTTGVAALLLKRKYIGIDTEMKYLDITINRIKKTR